MLRTVPVVPVVVVAALLHLAVGVALLADRLVWDALWFLTLPDHHVDLLHLLYVPTLCVLDAMGLDVERGAKLLSCIAATACLVAGALCLRALGASLWTALATAGLFVTSRPFWLFAETAEVYVPSLAFLLVGTAGALRYRAGRGIGALVTAASGAMLAAGYHLGALAAWPVLVAVAAGGARPRPRRHVVVLAAAPLVLVVVAVLLGATTGKVRWFAHHVASWLPDLSRSSFADHLVHNAWTLVRFCAEGAPALAALGLAAWWLGLRRRGPAWWLGTGWVLAFAGPFVALGVSRTALLTAAQFGWAPLVVAGCGHPLLRGHAAVRHGVLLAALAAQTAVSLPEVQEWTTPDPRRLVAERIAADTPPDVVLFSQRHSHHLSYYTDVPVHSLDHLVRDTHIVYGADANVGHRILLEAWRERHAGRRPFILREGLRYVRSLGFDQGSLPVDESAGLRLGPTVALPIMTPDGEPPGGD